MSIRISVKNKPFSKDVGAKCILPNSPYRATVYPSKVVCAALEIPLEHHEFIRDFMVQQDLERGFVRIVGKTENGQVAYRLSHRGKELVLFDEKKKVALTRPVMQPSFPRGVVPKLSCGQHKKQDVYEIIHRKDPREYLPFLFHIGIGYPLDEIPAQGVGALVREIGEVIDAGKKEAIVPAFEKFIICGIESIFSPVLHDAHYTGVLQGHLNVAPHVLLSHLAHAILKMVFREEEKVLYLLPMLPPQLHCGRVIRIPFSLGTIDIEWTKKKIRRAVIHAKKTGSCSIRVDRDICSYRFQVFQKGNEVQSYPGDIHTLEGGTTYLLDRFQK